MIKTLGKWHLAAVVLAVGLVSAARAEDVTITVWSHEADEPAKVALREQAAKQSRGEPSRRPRQDHLVREGRSLHRAADGAAGRPGAGRLLCRARSDRIHHQRLSSSRSTIWSTGTTSTTGRARYGPMTARPGRCRRRPIPTSSTTTRTCWRSSASSCPTMRSSRRPQFLDLVKKARAADITPIAQGVGDRPYPGAYVLGEALLRKLGLDDYGKLLARQAVLRGSARRRGLHLGQAAGRRRRLSEELHDAQARRVASLFLPEAGRADVPDGQLLHRPRLRAGRQGRPGARLPDRHHAVPRHGRGGLQRMQDGGRRRELRHQCREQAPGPGSRLSQRAGDARDGQALDRDGLSADRRQDRRRPSSAAPMPAISRS